MLGNTVAEARGKRTGRRVLSTDGGFKVEVSFEGTGKVLGHDMFEIGTYWSQSRPDGTLYGEGEGVVMCQDGNMASWKGQGVGVLQPTGSVSYRGAVYYSTASPALASLNKVAAVFEFDVDPDGNTHSTLWEWK